MLATLNTTAPTELKATEPNLATAYVQDTARKQLETLLRDIGVVQFSIEIPPSMVRADLAVPLFAEAKQKGVSPHDLAATISAQISLAATLFEKTEASGGYINFFFDQKQMSSAILNEISILGASYGDAIRKNAETVIVDYSAPNIAKPFSIGHLRSTIIGQALCNVLGTQYIRVIGDNHIGDWGTQFGKLLYAYQKSGLDIHSTPSVQDLVKLYVSFHQQAEHDESLNIAARNIFRQLENRDSQIVAIWNHLVSVSMSEFERIYKLLGGIRFDHQLGESFYCNHTQEVLTRCLRSKVIFFDSESELDSYLSNLPDGDRPIIEAILIRDDLLLQEYLLPSDLGNQKYGLSQDSIKKLESHVGDEFLDYEAYLTFLKTYATEINLDVVLRSTRRKSIHKKVLCLNLDLAEGLSHAGYELLDSQSCPLVEWSTTTVGDDFAANQQGTTVAVIRLEKFGISTPLLLQKSDGTSLYATRDIAAAIYRIREWGGARLLYVVGSEQGLHFRQLAAVMKILGYRQGFEHIAFGLIRLKEGKMSTRLGRVILLEDVLDRAVAKANSLLSERGETDKDNARIIGVGAVKFADLMQDRTREIIFDWDKMLSMSGDSCPYIQYAVARANAIVRRYGSEVPILADMAFKTQFEVSTKEEYRLLIIMSNFPLVLRRVADTSQSSHLAKFLLDLAFHFNLFYNSCPVLDASIPDITRQSRMWQVSVARMILQRGLSLLGIMSPQSM